MAADDYAVVVGINHYPDPTLDDLNGAENDAVDFSDWLLLPTGGALPNDSNHLHRILSSNYISINSAFRAKPMTAEIDAAFEEIVAHVRQSGRVGRRLYIYLAGHGIVAGDIALKLVDACLLMANAGGGRMGHHISGRAYASWFQGAALFQEVVILMDCCRYNLQRAPLRPPPWDALERTDASVVRSFYGFATGWDRASREDDIEGNGRIRGLFTYALVSVLRSGRMTGKQLSGCVFKYLRELSPGVPQDPKFDNDDNYDIVFSESALSARLPVHITFPSQLFGHNLELIDDKWNRRGTYQATAGGLDLTLELGNYAFIDAGATTSKPYRFEVIGGGTRHVQL